MTVPEIRTDRLVLRALHPSDAPRFAECCADFEVSKWLSVVSHPYAVADAEWFIGDVTEKASRVWAITKDGTLIGTIGLDREFGYWLAPEFWRQGNMTEAADAVLAYAFENGQDVLLSGYFVENHRSGAVLRKLGFVETGRRTQFCVARDADVQSIRMELTTGQYKDMRQFRIDTKRLIVRETRLSDWRDFARIGGQKAVARNLATVSSPWAETDVKAWIKRGLFRGRIGFRSTIATKGGAVLGMVGLGKFPNSPHVSAAYFIDPDCAGNGYTTEAMRGFFRFAFDRFDLAEIHADHFHDNPASAAVMRKLGFELFGQSMGTSFARLEPAPVFEYRLIKAKFEATHEVS